jgi:hypothetical protein
MTIMMIYMNVLTNSSFELGKKNLNQRLKLNQQDSAMQNS